LPTIKELADAEADRAEAEDDDTEPDADPDAEPDTDDTDPDAEPEPDPAAEPEPINELQLDRAMSDIEQAGDSYTEHVKAIQHETPLGLVECPLCPVPGFVSENPMPEIDPNQRAAVLWVMGEGQQREKTPHPNLHRCDACDGDGLLPTGSRRPEFAEQPCPKCGGNGYVDRVAEQAMADARLAAPLPPDFDQVPAPHPTNNAVPTPTVTQGGHTFPLVLGGAPDQLGRLPGHPLWGQPIQMGGL
jgi:hypothetical protein